MLSIIIPAHNEEKYIESTLKSIKNQPFKDYEIIVVCNGCIDFTYKIAKKYTNKVFNIKEANVSKARNYGASKAKYNKLIFLDADIQLTKNTLPIISKINCFGTCKALPDKNKLSHSIIMKIKNLINRTGRSTGLIFCNKNIFEKVKFNEFKRLGEDTEFIKNCKKYSNFKFTNTYVINSMRRFNSLGYFALTKFWLIKWLLNKNTYPTIR